MGISKGVSTFDGVVRSFKNIVVRGGRLRKRGGEVVSYAPQVAELLGGASRAAMGVLLVGGSMAAAPAAFAQSCNPVSDECLGSSPVTTPTVVSISGGNVKTEDGYSLTTTGPSTALTIISTGAAQFNDQFESEISSGGAGLAIDAQGAVTVDSNGSIIAEGGDGIAIVTQSVDGGAVLAELSGSVEASGDAISVRQFGNGDVWVQLDADASLTGGMNGVNIANAGTKSSNVLNDGRIDGQIMGVFAASAVAGDINVNNTGTITGVLSGAHAWQMAGSTGNILFTNDGIIAGSDGSGVSAVHQGAADISLINNSTGIVAGTANGVNFAHGGEGDVIVNNQGAIYALVESGTMGGVGISVNSTAAAAGDINITNSGTVAAIGTLDLDTGEVTTTGYSLNEGIGLTHNGTGAISVTNSGAIQADWAIWAKHNGTLPADADPETNLIDLNNSAVLSASSSALWANAGADAEGNISLINSGTITNTSTETGVNYAAISAAHFGTGDVAISNDASVTATGLAIGASHDGTGDISVSSTGDVVSSNANAIRAVNYGGGNVEVTVDKARNTATAAGWAAISTAHTGTAATTITTNGLVSGNYSAIYAAAEGGAVALNNSATGTLQNLSGLTTDLAVEVGDLNGGLANATLENAGTITGTVKFGSGDDMFNNDGTWNVSGGTSDFGAGDDELNLNTNFNAVNTQFVGLETMNINADFNLGSDAVGQTSVTDGDVNFGEDATFTIAASLTGTDKLTASGDVVVDGELNLTTLGSTLGLAGTTYTIVEGDSVTGNFTNDLIETSAFMAWEVTNEDDRIDITYTQQRDLADAALTPNQAATADGVDSLGYNNALRDALLHVADDATAQSAFTQLSGELHPGIRTALIEDSRLPRNAVLDRLQDPEGGAIWGQIFGSWGEIDAHRITNTHDMDRNTYGAILGFDLPISEDVVFGLAGSYTEHDFKQNQLSSTGSGETIHALAYFGAQSGSLNLKAGIGYGWGNVETKRDISFSTRGATGPVTFASTNTAKYDAELLQVFGEIGTRLPTGGGYIEPMVNLTYIDVKTDSFAETGGVSALLSDRETEKSLLSVVGTRFSTSASGPFSVRGLVGWQHAYGDLTPTSSVRFDGGDRFSIAGVQQSRNAGVVNIEGNFAYAGNSSISFGYDGVIGDHGQDHGAKMTLRIGF